MKKSLLQVLSLLLCFLPFSAYSQRKGPAGWHHGGSPFRAVFEIKDKPSIQKAGALISVPVCGIGLEDGKDIFCFDGKGKQLLSRSLGAGIANQAILQVQIQPDTKSILAYFGSRQRASSAKFDLTPPLCEVYTLPKGNAKNWPDVHTRLTEAKLIGRLPIRSLEQVCNPVDSREPFIMVMTAILNVKTETTRSYFIVSDDAGYIFIDDNLIISRNGINNIWSSMRGENRKDVKLTQGYHNIKLVAVNFENTFTAALGQWFPTPKVALVPPYDFVQSAKTELLAVEAHQKDAANPLFSYSHTAGMAIEDRQMTVTELATYGGQEAVWAFSDGVRLKGAKVTRVFGSLAPVEVKVQVKRQTAAGTVMFPQIAPPKVLQASIDNDYNLIDSFMPPTIFKNFDGTEQLETFLEFFLRKDLHPTQVPVAEALLAKSGISEELRLKASLALARSAAENQPDKSLKAYDSILKQRKLTREQAADILTEAVDFAIFRMRDFPVAARLIERFDSKLPKNGKAVLAMRFDLALQSGNLEEARKLYQSLLEGRTKAAERRSAAVQGNSIRANVSMLLSQNKILEAEAAMRDWVASSPQDRGNGSFSLERARCFHKRGWLDGAAGELTAAIQADPLLPNLPDVEFELALIYSDKGDKTNAKELFTKISRDYPNHPLAKEAARRIK